MCVNGVDLPKRSLFSMDASSRKSLAMFTEYKTLTTLEICFSIHLQFYNPQILLFLLPLDAVDSFSLQCNSFVKYNLSVIFVFYFFSSSKQCKNFLCAVIVLVIDGLVIVPTGLYFMSLATHLISHFWCFTAIKNGQKANRIPICLL